MFESYIHSHIHFVTHTKKHICTLTAPFGFVFFRPANKANNNTIQENKETYTW